MNKSESIKELATALCKAQAVIEGAAKDKTNPAFRSKYADLGNCWDAARKPLTDNGLSVAQFATADEAGVKVETMLMHVSGEYVSEILHIPLAKKDAHGVGAAITYGRRFGLCAIVGISPEDDDGNKAAGKGTQEQEEKPAVDTRLSNAAEAEARKGTQAFRAYWKALNKADRDQLEGRMEGLKALAQTADIAGFTKEMDKADAAI